MNDDDRRLALRALWRAMKRVDDAACAMKTLGLPARVFEDALVELRTVDRLLERG